MFTLSKQQSGCTTFLCVFFSRCIKVHTDFNLKAEFGMHFTLASREKCKIDTKKTLFFKSLAIWLTVRIGKKSNFLSSLSYRISIVWFWTRFLVENYHRIQMRKNIKKRCKKMKETANSGENFAFFGLLLWCFSWEYFCPSFSHKHATGPQIVPVQKKTTFSSAVCYT